MTNGEVRRHFQIDYVFQDTDILRIHGEDAHPHQTKEPLTTRLIRRQNAVCMVFAYYQHNEYTRKSVYELARQSENSFKLACR